MCLFSSSYITIVILFGGMDIQIATRSIRALVNFLGASAIVYLYWKIYKEEFFKYIILHLYIVLTLHAILMEAMYLNEELRLTIYSLTSAYDYVNLNSPFLAGLRITGLTYGLAQTSVVQMFGLLLLPSVLHYWGKHTFKIIVIIIAGFIIFASIFISGRSGLFLLIFLLPLTCIASCCSIKINLHGLKIGLTKVFIATMIIIFLIYITASFVPETISYNLKHSSEVIQVFTARGETETIKALQRMYFLPDSAVIFLFGSSNLGRGALGSIPSDVGYVRTLFAIGIIGVVLMLVPFVFGMWMVLKARIYEPYLAAATLGILVSSVLLNFKELSLLTRNQWSVQAILLCSCLLLIHNIRGKQGRHKLAIATNARAVEFD